MPRKTGHESQIHELLYQALETELGGIEVYTTALTCAINDELRGEWQEYLEETTRHREILLGVFDELGLDPEAATPGRAVCAHIAKALVKAMQMAKADGDAAAAQLVAGECVVLAETKDHQNWELIGHVAKNAKAPLAKVLHAAYEQVEKEEYHHLYHTAGWTRELWIDALGFPAVLPPPEEVRQVETAIGASRAEQARDTMLG